MNIRIALFLFLLLLLGVSMVSVSGVLAQEEGIELLAEEVVTEFPDRVVFKLSASSPDPIDEIRVFLKTKAEGRSAYGYLDLVPGESVDGEYVMDLSAAGYRPPGTVIKYHYEIRDQSGRTFTSEEREHLYLDESLDWKSITHGILTIYYYGEFVEKRAHTVLDAAQQTLHDHGAYPGHRAHRTHPHSVLQQLPGHGQGAPLPLPSRQRRVADPGPGLVRTSVSWFCLVPPKR